MLKVRQQVSQKPKLSQTLRSWLPLLQASSDDLEDEVNNLAKDNPCIKISSKKEINDKKSNKSIRQLYSKGGGLIEELNIAKKSIYDDLELQLNKTLFPTQKSQEIARIIISCLDENGYFIYDENACLGYLLEDIEKVRKRFCYLEPLGVGAINYIEALEFCLLNANLENELFLLCKKLINDLDNLSKYTKSPLYKDAIRIIKSFNLPPFIDDLEDSKEIIPDIYILNENGKLEIIINDDYYPQIEIQDYKELKEQVKNAKNLVDALEMRKATLKKLALMIVEYQYDYFLGGDIKPLKMQDLATELDRNTSTISRAIANKYISSNRGMIAIKDFFAAELNDGTSNKTIKEFVSELIKNENHLKPLSDQLILEKIEKEFNVKIVRRTITKYRKLLDIPSSSERKKLYSLR